MDISGQFPSQVPMIDEDSIRDFVAQDRETEQRVSGPFDAGERAFLIRLMKRPLEVCPSNRLSILLMSSPFVCKSLRKVINELVILYQHDAIFKPAVAQIFSLLYLPLQNLYCKFIGPQADSIFNVSVQIYTADSLVTMMSSEGVSSRIAQETEFPVHITKMLSRALLLALLYSRHRASGSPRYNLALSNVIYHKRLDPASQDLEYVTESSSVALKLLQGTRDPGFIQNWFIICECLQHVDPLKRKLGSHVDYENSKWTMVANLVLKMENLSAHFLSNAFHPANPRDRASPQMETLLLPLVSDGLDALEAWVDRNLRESHLGDVWPRSQGLECNFVVSRDNLSIYLPLHHFIGRIIVEAISGGCSLPLTVVNRLVAKPLQCAYLMEHPLRCLAFSAQVIAKCLLYIHIMDQVLAPLTPQTNRTISYHHY